MNIDHDEFVNKLLERGPSVRPDINFQRDKERGGCRAKNISETGPYRRRILCRGNIKRNDFKCCKNECHTYNNRLAP